MMAPASCAALARLSSSGAAQAASQVSTSLVHIPLVAPSAADFSCKTIEKHSCSAAGRRTASASSASLLGATSSLEPMPASCTVAPSTWRRTACAPASTAPAGIWPLLPAGLPASIMLTVLKTCSTGTAVLTHSLERVSEATGSRSPVKWLSTSASGAGPALHASGAEIAHKSAAMQSVQPRVNFSASSRSTLPGCGTGGPDRSTRSRASTASISAGSGGMGTAFSTAVD